MHAFTLYIHVCMKYGHVHACIHTLHTCTCMYALSFAGLLEHDRYLINLTTHAHAFIGSFILFLQLIILWNSLSSLVILLVCKHSDHDIRAFTADGAEIHSIVCMYIVHVCFV